MTDRTRTIYAELEGGRVIGDAEAPRLGMRASTYRGRGTEWINTFTPLRPLLVSMARHPDLRRLMLACLIEADEAHDEARRAFTDSLEADRKVIRAWLDQLDPEELFVVLHEHGIAEVRYRNRYWMRPDVADPDSVYERALRRLPKGIGPVRLVELLDRYGEALTALIDDDFPDD